MESCRILDHLFLVRGVEGRIGGDSVAWTVLLVYQIGAGHLKAAAVEEAGIACQIQPLISRAPVSHNPLISFTPLARDFLRMRELVLIRVSMRLRSRRHTIPFTPVRYTRS